MSSMVTDLLPESRTLHLVHRLTAAQVGHLHELYGMAWWSKRRTREDIETMLEHSDFLFGLCEPEADRLVAFARVLTDRVYRAFVYDVIVDLAYRDRGLGRRLMESICAHPVLSAVEQIGLSCLPDMVRFYEKWGFSDQVGQHCLMRRT